MATEEKKFLDKDGLEYYTDKLIDKLESSYPIASATNIGIMQVGDGLNVDGNGKVSVASYEASGLFFATVAEMTSYALKEGDIAITSGYYLSNDGGGAKYEVVSGITADNYFAISLGSGLSARLIVENNQVNIRQIGARSQVADNDRYDIAPYIQAYLNYLDTVRDRIKLYIPSGVWYSSPIVIHKISGFSIIGDEQFINQINGGTMISSISDNQANIFTIGDRTDMCANFVLKNICFTSADFIYRNNETIPNKLKVSTIKNISDCCLKIQGCDFGDTDNLYFQHINGRALTITSSWEIRYRKLYFRDIDARDSSVVLFAQRVGTSLRPMTITNASMMDNVMFEQTLGDLFATESYTEVANFHFGVINFEDAKIDRQDVAYTDFTSENISTFEASNPTHFAVFRIAEDNYTFDSIVIESIELDQFACFYSTIDGGNYCYDYIFKVDGGKGNFSPTVNTITVHGLDKDGKILVSKVSNLDYRSSFILNNLYAMSSSYHDLGYDVENFMYIRHDGRMKGAGSAIEYRLPSNATPAYDMVINRNDGKRNIFSDNGSSTEPKLCVKLPSSGSALSFVVISNALTIVAKIPSGETAKIAINVVGGNQQVEDLVGTGGFAAYPITLGSQFSVGKQVNIGHKAGNTASSCLIDYIIN